MASQAKKASSPASRASSSVTVGIISYIFINSVTETKLCLELSETLVRLDIVFFLKIPMFWSRFEIECSEVSAHRSVLVYDEVFEKTQRDLILFLLILRSWRERKLDTPSILKITSDANFLGWGDFRTQWQMRVSGLEGERQLHQRDRGTEFYNFTLSHWSEANCWSPEM